MLRTYIQNVLKYYDHPMANALTEAVNSTIQMIKKKAYGIRNMDHFKTAIYFTAEVCIQIQPSQFPEESILFNEAINKKELYQ